ncbi:NAD-dependent epimerase/dehydratase family protein [Janibacter sp. GXQ6167]|uniref:NAD-dependent epimerase/dehydratase family protein n=1 Tax=Janibacter sp. GXQ6167 TaxID=3240791 RepID=UPI003526328B
MRILITGGAGFIGQHLARRLSSAHELVALDSLSEQVHLDPDSARSTFPGEVIVGDVADPGVWGEVPRPDAVIHLAAETGTGQSMYEQDRYVRVNVDGTRLAGEASVRWGAPLVAVSSRAVYGEGRHRTAHGTIGYGERPEGSTPLDSLETDPHHPVSVYGQTKSDGEAQLVDVAAPHVPVSIVRPQNVIGPGQALHNPYTGVLAAFLARLREGRALQIYGDGSQTRDFIHVADLAALLGWLVEHPADVGTPRVLNSGTGVRTSLNELARHAIAGSPLSDAPIEHVEVTRAGDIIDACADLSYGASLGAPAPQWTSGDAVANFIAWSWDKPGAASQAWDQALNELDSRGLTS